MPRLRSLSCRGFPSTLAALVVLSFIWPGSAGAAGGAEAICAGKGVCRIVQTGLPLRVMPRVNSSIYETQDVNGRVIESERFVPLYVFDRIDVSYVDPMRPTGWFRVGKDADKPIGYIKAADTVEWRSADELRINVVYVIDMTEGMQPYIDAVTNATRDAQRILVQATRTDDRVSFGLIGYRNHPDSSKGFEFTVRNFTPELVNREKLTRVLEEHGRSRDGGYQAKDVFAGVLEGANSQWEPGAVRLLVLIGDGSGYEPYHRFATTDQDERSLRRLATEQGINIISLYIKARRAAADWERGIRQFRALAENPGPGEPAHRALDENPAEISNAILEMAREWRGRLVGPTPETSGKKVGLADPEIKSPRRQPVETSLPDVGCGLEDNLRSQNAAKATSITFVNRSGKNVRTYWINYQGKRVFYSELAPGRRYTQQTYVTHPWVITAGGGQMSGQCLSLFQPAEEPATAIIQ